MKAAWTLLPSASRRRRELYRRAASFANPDRSVLPGLFVRVRVPALEKRDALLVPGRRRELRSAGRICPGRQ